MANRSEDEALCSKRQRGQELQQPTSWRWSPEAQAYYEARAQEEIDKLVQEGKPLPRRPWGWDCGAAGRTDKTYSQIKREATLEMAAVLRHRDRKRLGVEDKPADFGTAYATDGSGQDSTPRLAHFIGMDWRKMFSPRLAYRTWVELSIKEDELKEFGYTRRLPQCVRDLIDASGSFFWQFVDCFVSLREKLNQGRGIHVANTGEFFALFLAIYNMNDGNDQDEILAEDDSFVALPELPSDKAGRTCDEYLRMFCSTSGPLGDGSPARKVCAPFALYEPSFLDDWAPVPEEIRRQQAEPDTAGHQTGSNHIQQTIDQIKRKFREQVKVPEQAAALAASFTNPAEWFTDYPPLDPDGSSQSTESVREETSADMEDSESLCPFEFSSTCLCNHLPSTPLHRADGATIRIGISPFEGEDGSRWGSNVPVMGQSVNCTEIVGFVMLPGEATPIGHIHANAVERDEHSWGSHSDFFWGCDAISEEFVNGVLTFLAVDKIATTKPQHGQSYGRVRTALKAPPHKIPASCDDGPLLVIERVFIEKAHRGTELGMDALVAFLRAFRWSLALAHIAELPDRDRSESSPTTSGADRCMSLRQYFERVHFMPGVPGGYPGLRNLNNNDNVERSSRYHWLSREHFDSGGFDLKQCRLVAALQRLALSGILSTRLASQSVHTIEDVLLRCLETVPRLTSDLEVVQKSLASLDKRA